MNKWYLVVIFAGICIGVLLSIFVMLPRIAQLMERTEACQWAEDRFIQIEEKTEKQLSLVIADSYDQGFKMGKLSVMCLPEKLQEESQKVFEIKEDKEIATNILTISVSPCFSSKITATDYPRVLLENVNGWLISADSNNFQMSNVFWVAKQYYFVDQNTETLLVFDKIACAQSQEIEK